MRTLKVHANAKTKHCFILRLVDAFLNGEIIKYTKKVNCAEYVSPPHARSSHFVLKSDKLHSIREMLVNKTAINIKHINPPE